MQLVSDWSATKIEMSARQFCARMEIPADDAVPSPPIAAPILLTQLSTHFVSQLPEPPCHQVSVE